MPTVLQIENREDEYNPYAHSPQDNIAHMNLDYWEEQIKATIAIAAHLAVPVTWTEQVYLPAQFRSFRGREVLDRPNTVTSSCFLYQVQPQDDLLVRLCEIWFALPLKRDLRTWPRR